MATQFSKQVVYERLTNGADVYLLSTTVRGLVIVNIALPGGRLTTYEKQSRILLISELFPYGTKQKTKQKIREQFDALGASITATSTDEHTVIHCVVRKAELVQAVKLIFETLVHSSIPQSEFTTARTRCTNKLQHQTEDTYVEARKTLIQNLYKKGHPVWSPSTTQLLSELTTLQKKEYTHLHKNMLTGTGAVLTVVGDIQPKKIQASLRSIVGVLPEKQQLSKTNYSVQKVRMEGGKHNIVSLKDKTNVDTVAGIPLSLPYDAEQFLPLSVGVYILGGSSTSRMFNTLRTRESLTYGAYASLEGYTTENPGYLRVSSIFPNTLYLKGRESMLRVLDTFLEKGVAQKELTEYIEQICSAYVVGLATTQGISTALLGTVLKKYPVAYLDTYPERVQNISVRELNAVSRMYIDSTLVKTAAAGSVDKNGKTL